MCAQVKLPVRESTVMLLPLFMFYSSFYDFSRDTTINKPMNEPILKQNVKKAMFSFEFQFVLKSHYSCIGKNMGRRRKHPLPRS